LKALLNSAIETSERDKNVKHSKIVEDILEDNIISANETSPESNSTGKEKQELISSQAKLDNQNEYEGFDNSVEECVQVEPIEAMKRSEGIKFQTKVKTKKRSRSKQDRLKRESFQSTLKALLNSAIETSERDKNVKHSKIVEDILEDNIISANETSPESNSTGKEKQELISSQDKLEAQEGYDIVEESVREEPVEVIKNSQGIKLQNKCKPKKIVTRAKRGESDSTLKALWDLKNRIEMEKERKVEKLLSNKIKKNANNKSRVSLREITSNPNKINFANNSAISSITSKNTAEQLFEAGKCGRKNFKVGLRSNSISLPDKTSSKQENLQMRSLEILIKCDYKSCGKWRVIKDIDDPSELPNYWTCKDCSEGHGEEIIQLKENTWILQKDQGSNCHDNLVKESTKNLFNKNTFIDATFVCGSIIWSRFEGKYMPAIVEYENITKEFFMWEDEGDWQQGWYYHISYLGNWKKDKYWQPMDNIKPLTIDEIHEERTLAKNKKMKNKLGYLEALKQAEEYLSLNRLERIEKQNMANYKEQCVKKKMSTKKKHSTKRKSEENSEKEVDISTKKRKRGRPPKKISTEIEDEDNVIEPKVLIKEELNSDSELGDVTQEKLNSVGQKLWAYAYKNGLFCCHFSRCSFKTFDKASLLQHLMDSHAPVGGFQVLNFGSLGPKEPKQVPEIEKKKIERGDFPWIK